MHARWKVLVLSAALMGLARETSAQVIETPPRGAIFGTGGGASQDRLDVIVAASEAFEKEPPPELQQRIQQTGGTSSLLTVGADYQRQRRRTRLTAQGFSSILYYPGFEDFVSSSYSAGVGGEWKVSRLSTLEVSQSATYSPSDLYNLFPTIVPPVAGDVTPPSPDHRVDPSKSFSYNSLVSMRFGSPRGSQFQASVERSGTEFQGGGTDRPDLGVAGGTLGFARGLGRAGALTVQYQYRQGEYGLGGNTTEQRVQIGASVSRALSVTRRLEFRFTLAPSAIDLPPSTLTPLSGTLYRLEGDASVDYPVSRSWTVRGGYWRGLDYISVLSAPVLRDSGRVDVSGLLNERIDVVATAGYAAGTSALDRDSQNMDSYTGSVRARYSVSRSLAVYGQYLYYYYDLRGQTTLAPNLPRRFEQNGVRLGLMLWARPVGR